MNDILISVIVPVYNVEKYLDRCIDSIVNQTYRNLEIILVDDGSPDNCPKMCDDWAKKDGRIKVIHKENGGLSSARNAGLDICIGEYIHFVDSDDWLELSCIELLLDACVQNGALLSVCGRYIIVHEKRNIDKNFSENQIMSTSNFVSNMLVGKNCDSSPCGKLYHKSLWVGIRFPHGRIYEDIAILYKLFLIRTLFRQ